MRVDLHSNGPIFWQIGALADSSGTPNPEVGYLKSYLMQDPQFDIRNIYWDIIPSEISNRFRNLMIELNTYVNSEIAGTKTELSLPAFFSNYFYKNSPDLSASLLEKILNSSHFFSFDIEGMVKQLKNHIDQYYKNKKIIDTDVAWFTMKTNQWLLNYYLIKKIKNEQPAVKIVIGDILSESQGKVYLNVFKEADFAIWGEGELPFLRLIQDIKNPMKYSSVPNLIYRKDAKINSTFPLALNDLPDINSIPFADHSDYFKTLKEFGLDIPVQIPIRGVKSCWWNNCIFCHINEGIPYRARKPEKIIAEIEYQSQKYDINDFIFIDNDIGRKDYKNFEEFLDLLLDSSRKKNERYRIQAELSPLFINQKNIEKMKKISIIILQIGFEAMTDSLLQKMKKPQSFAHNIQALKFAEEQDFILTGLNIIQGIPTETEKDVIESIENLKFLRFLLSKFNFSENQLLLIKGLTIFNNCIKNGTLENWNTSGIWNELMNIDFLSNIDKREFFGFSKDLSHTSLWELFHSILEFYQSNPSSFLWIKNSNGSSNIYEFRDDKNNEICSYSLNQIETEILIFCNAIKKIKYIQKHFSDISQHEFIDTLTHLKKAGLIYFDNLNGYCVSTINSNNIILK